MPSRKKMGSAAPGSTPTSRVAVLLEDIQGKVQATMEAVTATRNELLGEIQKLRLELSGRIDVLALAVRQNSTDIRELKAEVGQLKARVGQNTDDIRRLNADVEQLKAEVRRNTEEIRSMREVLERKVDREGLLKLEARVEAMEKRLGIQ